MLTGSRISDLIEAQRQFFATGKTKDINFRIEQLERLKQAVIDSKELVIDALNKDLRKSELEAYLTEVGVIREVNYVLKHIKSWAKPKTVARPLDQFPSVARIYPDPLGVVLIISPWNYPFQLTISPLLGAIAAGNCVTLKPSEISPHTSRLVADLIRKTFDPSYIAVVEGGVEASQDLLSQKFDHIFFTGGTQIGRIVMEAAAKHLTPVTLELGGKSPCIVETDIDLPTACKRIVWGKFINAGQTCIAPDYLLVNRRIKGDLLLGIKRTITEFFGQNPANSPDYGRIISAKQFDRLRGLLQEGEIIVGGQTDAGDRYIAPTVIDGVSLTSPIMQEEIFGPILPILEYDKLDEAIALINQRPKPLALYLFSNDKQKQQKILRETSSGGVCLNDTIMHLGVSELPFGGVGDSGMGAYHGKASFDTFSHRKSVLEKSFRLDLDFRYPPYKNKLDFIKRFIGG
ncbi:aldehyde dehydrogenase [Laspinema olomoucense]|uniref:aldehyde dehydrogenase n=1 Tax=Laspinema olomoucense TaxID=3231600 RepID=UPI0021BACFE4|nr:MULTISPECIES: aldehyde dehydrogenase [unclassified Laspinema]MCT7990640.1 aldehyde dehydrogenase [Laspinema sp. D3a]MCT7994662.1 aldehyde dehydrogenase [Laspinema sp. D3c]